MKISRARRTGFAEFVQARKGHTVARYFFDIDDGSQATRDDEGLPYDTVAEMRGAAIGALPGIAADGLPNGEQRVFSVRVRNEDGQTVFHATLTLIATWFG